MKKLIFSLSAILALNAQVIHLENGWNNIGLTNDVPLSSLNNSAIEYVWKYNSRDGKWYFYSKDENYNATVRGWINNGGNYGFINSLNPGDAIWIKSNRVTDIDLNAPVANNEAVLVGFVKDALTNEPINNFTVIIDNQEHNFNNTNGEFDLENVSTGNHTITIVADGYEPATISVNVENNDRINIGQVALVPQQVANTNVEVTGQILNAVTGDIITEPVRLRVFEGYNNTSGDPVIDTIVNNGNYDINLQAGNYTFVLDADGYYETTYNYTFAPEDGNNVIRQNLVLSPEDTNISYALRATLTWGEYPTDLDSHLLAYAPDSNHSVWHVYFGNHYAYVGDKRVADLDVDDTTSFGPEHITLYDLNNSMKYVYYVWNYSNDGELKNSNAEVKVYYNGHLYDFRVPYADGRGWKVFEIENGVLVPCETNCMVPDDFDIYNLRPISSQENIINELITTATSSKE